MSKIPLTIATLPYDHMLPLRSGAVQVEGAEASFPDAGYITEIFRKMATENAFDVAELGLTFYLRLLEMPDPQLIAIPVFPNRHFRHSSVYVNTGSGIERPEDLRGKVIGELALFGHDAGIWPKGILADDFGVTPDQSRWVIGGVDFPMKPVDWVPFIRPEGIDIALAPDGRGLGPMLESGEIDALISAIVPEAWLNGSPRVAQLFPDVERVERDYYRRTGIYPMMHTVVVRRALIDEHPGLVQAIYRAFEESATMTHDQYARGRAEQHVNSGIPWFSELVERNRRLLNEDYWAHGLKRNHTAIDTYLRYFHEQGLSRRRWTPEEIFAPELLDT